MNGQEATNVPSNDRQNDNVETVTAAEAKPQVDSFSQKLAELAKKEKWIRAQRSELEKERAANKAKLAEYETSYVPKSQIRDLIMSDPTQIGLSHEELLNLALNQPTPESQATRKLEQKIQELEAKIREGEQKADDRTKQAYDQAVSQIRTEAKLLIESDSRFETVKERDMAEAVVSLITETFDESGTVMSVEDAATQVENFLIEEGIKMANLKKVKEKLTPAPAAEVPAVAEPKAPTQVVARAPMPKTLTHAMSATTPTKLTEKQRRERAIMAFRGQPIS